ncbi:response regulator [Parasedimentitalea marina]|uniref:Sensory/regulatory protein RpfC n=1 Tax=Parasedimentitalea marina TaxID=2483033 RepID=A0A3T0N3C6_9RHOB|nr:ATP-binding protein [Parasedimentitalea marina]AZV78499.1 response regulator [Parasedimentitalea marina]
MTNLSDLRTKLVIYTVLIVLTVAGFISAVSIAFDHRNSTAAFISQATALAETLSEAAVEPIYSMDVRLLRQQVNSTLTNDHAIGAYVLDTDEKILTDGSDENQLRGTQISSPIIDHITETNGWITLRDNENMTVGGPVLLTEGYVLGYVVLEFSMIELNDRLLAQVRQTLALSGLCVLITSLAAIVVSRQITQPIIRLTDFATQLKNGTSDRKVPDCGKGEVGRLAQSFSKMLDHMDISNKNLQNLAGSLEKQVRDRTQAAEAGSKAKSEFLAVMSHEIRTPMNGVLGMTSLLLETKLNEEQEEYARTISESGEALLVIINDILDFSRIEAGKMELDEEPFELETLLLSVLSLLSQTRLNENVTLKLDYASHIPKTFIGDEGRVRQIVTNLVGNSQKFTENGSICIGVTGSSKSGATVLNISVKDTGIGIPESKLTGIFDAFSQVDSTNARSFGGTGMGLTIASNLARLMGGDIRVKSQVGKGSTFTFRCKMRITESLAPTDDFSIVKPSVVTPNDPPIAKDSKLGETRKILLADDNKTNRLVVQRMLKATDLQIIHAQDGSEAVQQFITHKPKLVFMDISMPKLTGIEATREIRSFEAKNSLLACPIIALTANAMKGDREKYLENGMDDYLSKPVRKSDLTELIAYWSQERSGPG